MPVYAQPLQPATSRATGDLTSFCHSPSSPGQQLWLVCAQDLGIHLCLSSLPPGLREKDISRLRPSGKTDSQHQAGQHGGAPSPMSYQNMCCSACDSCLPCYLLKRNRGQGKITRNPPPLSSAQHSRKFVKESHSESPRLKVPDAHLSSHLHQGKNQD